jgi:hypothetical protein
VIEDVPALRIIDEALWGRVKARQVATRKDVTEPGAGRSKRARRPRYLFSGLLTCGVCGGGYTPVGKRHYGCANARNRGTCGNRLNIRRDLLEETVLTGLRDTLLHPDQIAEFVGEHQRAFNRLQRDVGRAQAAQQKKLGKIGRQIERIVEAIKDGFYMSSMKQEMASMEARKAALTEALAAQVAKAPALHPGLAAAYRSKVAELTSALNDDSLRTEAAEALRALISEIRLIPKDGALSIELVGELAGLLALGNASGPRDVIARAGQITLVAGVGFGLWRTRGHGAQGPAQAENRKARD